MTKTDKAEKEKKLKEPVVKESPGLQPGFQMWRRFHVKIKLRDKLVGGYPKNPDAEEAMLRARGLEDLIPPPVDPNTLDEAGKAELAKRAVEKTATGFKFNGHGNYVESRCVKAMIKECANILKAPALLNITAFKSKVAERVFVEPMQILLNRVPDGTDSRTIHVMTTLGPRSSIKFYDYYIQPELEFNLKVLNDGLVDWTKLKFLFEYAQENGFGADRSQGFGQFDLVELEEVQQ